MTVPNVAQTASRRKGNNFLTVTKSLLSDNVARFSADECSISKQLSAFFALRHKPDFRYSQKLARWLYRDRGGRWRLATNEPLIAARQVCNEAAPVMGRSYFINTDGAANDVLRLAAFLPAMTQTVALNDCEAELARMLRGRS